MKRIEVKLALPVVAPLLDVVRELAAGLKQDLAAPLGPTDLDGDFAAAWTSELLAAQSADVTALLGMFNDDFFAEGVITCDESNAESIVRATAAVRLRLRQCYLQALGDEVLESGNVALDPLPEPVRKAFMCYLFLATLQELIIQHLDSGILGH